MTLSFYICFTLLGICHLYHHDPPDNLALLFCRWIVYYFCMFLFHEFYRIRITGGLGKVQIYFVDSVCYNLYLISCQHTTKNTSGLKGMYHRREYIDWRCSFSGVHSVAMVFLARLSEGGDARPTPFVYPILPPPLKLNMWIPSPPHCHQQD